VSQEPRIEERAAQHYAGIQATVPMDGISAVVDQALPELFGWLAGQGTAPAGPPFIRFLVIDMEALLQLELGVPVAEPITESGRIQPAGRYVVLRHVGPYDGPDGLIPANAAAPAVGTRPRPGIRHEGHPGRQRLGVSFRAVQHRSVRGTRPRQVGNRRGLSHSRIASATPAWPVTRDYKQRPRRGDAPSR
jgi:GyrI-like small molecule binding domain